MEHGTENGLSEVQIRRLSAAFNRYKVPGEADMHADDLTEILRYLGHIMTNQDGVMAVLKEVTSYDYIDVDEFLSFMEKFLVYEREEIRKIFNAFDDDGSGEISKRELRKLISHIGLLPLRNMIRESLLVVDQDNSGQLDFHELMMFLALFRKAEGFTQKETTELQRVFGCFSEDVGHERLLQPDNLSDALVQCFGLGVRDHAVKFQNMLLSGEGRSQGALAKKSEPESMAFSEFLIFARKIREAEFAKLKTEYPEWWRPTADLDQLIELKQNESGAELGEVASGISEAELHRVLKDNKLTPLRAVINEIFDDVLDEPWTTTSELDFDELFEFMWVINRREGFMKAEMEELIGIFRKFDEDSSGEISTFELSEMLRHLGYSRTFDDVRDLVNEVDKNESGQLDLREFLMLMRLFRENELSKLCEVFAQSADEAAPSLMPGSDLPQVLEALNYDLPALPGPGASLDFDEFVGLVKSCHDEFVAKERKKAGFTEEEIDELQDLFNVFDRDRSGDIDVMELQKLLKEFGWEPKTREGQQMLLQKIEQARERCRDAGVKDLGPAGSMTIRFWEFVRLIRTLRTENDKADEDAMAKLREKLKFTEQEVDQFRGIFRFCFVQFDDPDNPTVQPKRGKAMLPCNHIRRLIRSLGVQFTPASKQTLDSKIQSLDAHGRVEAAELDLMDFLRLMRWLLDTDFGGINKAVSPGAA